MWKNPRGLKLLMKNRTEFFMKNKILSYLCFFLIFTASTLTECILTMSFAWAGFNGFGGVTMEYTEKGNKIAHFMILFPYLVCLIIIIFLIRKLYKQKKTFKNYLQYILTGVLGIAAGIIFFLVDSHTLHITWECVIYKIIHFIENSDWMIYPIP